MSPARLQRKRTKGWRKPESAVVVTRGSRWGNPYRIEAGRDGTARVCVREGQDVLCVAQGVTEERAREVAVSSYRSWLEQRPDWVAAARSELAGRDLMCWCPLVDCDGVPVPCHADVLLEIANSAPRN
jgi:hypothetical protein